MPHLKRGMTLFQTLHRRQDFLAAAKGTRSYRSAYSLQHWEAKGREGAPPRIGLTVTKKTGSAVERNRIKRRFRSLLRQTPDIPALPGHDYVIIAKREALYAKFAELADDVRRAMKDVHDPLRSRNQPRSSKKRATGSACGITNPQAAAPEQDQAIKS